MNRTAMIGRGRVGVVVLLMVCAVAAAQEGRRAGDPPTPGEAAAMRAAGEMMLAVRAGDTERVATYIDGRAMAQRIYGEELRRDTPGALEEAYLLLARRVADFFSEMRETTQDGGSFTSRGENVHMDLRMKNPDGKVDTISIIMAPSDGGWKLIDFGAGEGKWWCEKQRELQARHAALGTPAQRMKMEAKWSGELRLETDEDEAAIARLTTQSATRKTVRVEQATALEASKAYVEMLRGGDAVRAYETFWDLELLAREVFDEHWQRTDEPRRLRTIELLDEYLRPELTRPAPTNAPLIGVMGAIRTAAEACTTPIADVRDFESKARSDESVEVTYRCTIRGREASVRLRLRQTQHGWKIFDLSHGGESVVGAMRTRWRLKGEKALGTVQFVRNLRSEARRVQEGYTEQQRRAAPGGFP